MSECSLVLVMCWKCITGYMHLTCCYLNRNWYILIYPTSGEAVFIVFANFESSRQGSDWKQTIVLFRQNKNVIYISSVLTFWLHRSEPIVLQTIFSSTSFFTGFGLCFHCIVSCIFTSLTRFYNVFVYFLFNFAKAYDYFWF